MPNDQPEASPAAAAPRYGAAYNPPPAGALDRFIRRFGAFSPLVAVLVMYALVAVVAGLALAPALAFIDAWWTWSAGFVAWQKWPLLGIGVGLAFFVAGFSLLVVVPILNFVLPTRIKAFEGGYFRSGDIAFLHEDGYIKITDRAKDIIISGGENVSSVEVEGAISHHPAVSLCAVVAKPDETWGEVPCAFVELKAGMQASEEEIIKFVRARLAGFKTPKRVIFADLPNTATGKIQKFELRAVAKLV